MTRPYTWHFPCSLVAGGVIGEGMKALLAVFVTIGLSLALAALVTAADEQAAQPLQREKLDKIESKPVPSATMPLYRPPQGRIPGGRLKGGLRGGKDAPIVQVLAPDHVGLTRHKQPTLYWYLSKPSPYPIEFTFVDSRTIPPVVETQLPPPPEVGVQALRLKDFGVSLEVGVPYRWFISLVVDRSNPSKDITAGAIIERVSYLEGMMIHSANEEDPVGLAAAGLWYDAVRAISAKIESSPGDPYYRGQRAFLLQQVGLSEVAEFDLKRSRQ